MYKKNKLIETIWIAIVCCLTTCQKKDSVFLPVASIIVGKVDLYNSKGKELLKENQNIKGGDTIHVHKDSKIKFELRSGTLWYVNRESKLVMHDLLQISGNKRSFYLSLLNGHIHIVNSNEINEEYIIDLAGVKIRAISSDITIIKKQDIRKCEIILLSGFATFTINDGTETVIPQCNKVVIDKDNVPDIEQISCSDITNIKSWIGTTVIEKALKRSGCKIVEDKAQNMPPVWKRLPTETALINEYYIDTVEAIDPELTPVQYTLIKGPSGIEFNENSGIIKFKPASIGEIPLLIEARDAQELSCTVSVNIKVIKGFSLSLSITPIIEPLKPVTILPHTKGINIRNTQLRYDLDGNGIFEIPSNGNFGPIYSINKYIFEKEGIFYISAEAKSRDGLTAYAKKKIIINSPPKASLKASAYETEIENPVELDATSCFDNNTPLDSLRIRFDINGDGIWDIPNNNEFTLQKRFTYKWEKDGEYIVKMQVVDKYGYSDIDSIKINVIKSPKQLTDKTIYITIPDSFYTSDSIEIGCDIKNGGIELKKIEWYLDNDTIVDKTTTKLKEKVSFKDEGEFNIRCVAIDKNGAIFTKERKIKVKKRKISINTGGPYKEYISKEIIFKGSGDSVGVKKYYWDFNGDGAIDWTSEKIEEAKFTYHNSGKYIAFFCAEMKNGEKVLDSTTVEIINHPPVANAGEDIISEKGKKIKLNGTGKDDDGNISLYEWDFNGDGVFDWSSPLNGTVEKEFFEYTIAIFRVMDSDSAFALDSIRIVICPEDMQLIEKGKFCIDRYEYPNKANSIPLTDVTFEEAEQYCKKEGKRLCSSSEWESACKGEKKNVKYPYGNRFIYSNCNTAGNPIIKNSIAPSGKFSECKNSYSIFDMSGNVAEWVTSDKNEAYIYGGSWQSGEKESKCDSKILLKKGKKYFYVGFRCCK